MMALTMVGQTPRRLVWWRNKARLYHYESAGPKPHSIPLLIVYAPIGRPFILDLYPEHSFVDWMRQRGLDIFLLDWGRPGLEDRALGLSEYVLDYLPSALRRVQEITGVRRYSMLGWSVGGLFAAIHAALAPECLQPIKPSTNLLGAPSLLGSADLRNLALVTAPIDFGSRESSGLARLVDERWFPLDRLLHTFDNVPGELVAWGAILADPVHSLARPWVELWDGFFNLELMRHWQAMSQWATDLVPVTGRFFRDLVELYRSNALTRGTLSVRGQRVDLGRIRASLLNVTAMHDLITPPCQSEGLLDIVGSRDKQNLRLSGTHIECMAGMRAPNESWPRIYEWLAARSE